MSNRHLYNSREAIGALNLIDVAFHEDLQVGRLWREYHSLISKKSFFENNIGVELRHQKLIELQTEMARVLGFAVDQFDVERKYQPQWLDDEEFIAQNNRMSTIQKIESARKIDSIQTMHSGPNKVSGIYQMNYRGGENTAGIGIVCIKNGSISGVDMLGSKISGEYADNKDGNINITAKMIVEAGTPLVTGFNPDRTMSIPISGTVALPPDPQREYP